jgi:hypothetical protein
VRLFGIVIHHSNCPSINEKGYDFFVAREGTIIPSLEQTDPLYLHICLEGSFVETRTHFTPEEKEQLFLLNKLTLHLASLYRFAPDDLYPHSLSCPGTYFPWSQLVISPDDRYH